MMNASDQAIEHVLPTLAEDGSRPWLKLMDTAKDPAFAEKGGEPMEIGKAGDRVILDPHSFMLWVVRREVE